MRVINTVAELQELSHAWRAGGEAIGFVPTMGALHPGHLSLVEAARRDNSRVIVSVFVNPTQFDDKADLRAYPRDFEGDGNMLKGAGVDALFHPEVEEMYPSGLVATRVSPASVADRYEGKARRGHFDGVATVVARLFNAALPDRAYFGRKDAQQLAVIRAMVRDLGFPIEVVGCPTVREPDGLAMSSRNGRLAAHEREAALSLVRSLARAQRRVAAGNRDARGIAADVRSTLEQAPGVQLEYAAVVDADAFEAPTVASDNSLAVVAARVGDVRLIDNAELGAGDLIPYDAPRKSPVTPSLQGVLL